MLHLIQHHRLGNVLACGVELDRSVERGHVGSGDGISHLLRIQRPGALQRVHVHEHRCGRLGRLVGWRVAKLLLESLRVLLGGAEPLVLVAEVVIPLRRAHRVFRRLPQLLGDLRGVAVREGQHRHVHLLIRGLSHCQRGAFRVARDDQHVRAQRLDLGQRGGHVVELGGQLVVDHHLHAVFLGVLGNVRIERRGSERSKNP